MKNNVEKKRKVTSQEPSNNTQEDLNKFSEELAKQISENQKKNPRNKKNVKKFSGKTIAFRINPFILVGIIILVLFVFSALFSSTSFSNRTSLDTIIKGIENNEYSQLLVQNDRRVVAVDKYYVTLEGQIDESLIDNELKVSSTSGENFNSVSFDAFLDSIEPKSVSEQLQEIFTNNSDAIQEIILGENYVIGARGSDFEDFIIEDLSGEEFLNLLEEENISIDDLSVPVRDLQIYSKTISQESFANRLQSEQYDAVYEIESVIVARISDSNIQRVTVDWTPNIDSFIDTLQSEDISLSESTVEIVSVNVPSGITLDDIFTIITIAGLVILVFVIYRSAQSSGMGLMQFGQSKAKMFFGQKTDASFDDVAGIDEAREELNEIVDFLKHPNKFRNLGARIPKGILMFGSPGTGKTLLARAIAGEAGVPFFHTSGSEFEEMLVGAGASRVRDLFEKAKKAAPSLIFIDEIDAVARKRGTRIQSGSTEQTLNQILVEMDGFEKHTNVIVIAATNRPDVLDPAILRPGRFDRQVRIELPDVDGREAILKIHGKNKPFAKDVDLRKVAKRTVGFTGADLENVLNESAIIAAKLDKKEITMEDIEEAVSKVVLGPAKRSRRRTKEELDLVAYHEAGHAVVSYFTPNATPVDKISIISRGGTGGVTMFLPDKEESIVSRGKLVADITVSLGGRAAEEIVLDDISTGASNDIKKATSVARRMIQQFGMNEKLGLVEYGEHEESGIGYSYGQEREYSEKTAEIIDDEVRDMVSVQYEKAKKILTEHRDKLDAVAKALLEKEVMDKDEFVKLMG